MPVFSFVFSPYTLQVFFFVICRSMSCSRDVNMYKSWSIIFYEHFI